MGRRSKPEGTEGNRLREIDSGHKKALLGAAKSCTDFIAGQTGERDQKKRVQSHSHVKNSMFQEKKRWTLPGRRGEGKRPGLKAGQGGPITTKEPHQNLRSESSVSGPGNMGRGGAALFSKKGEKKGRERPLALKALKSGGKREIKRGVIKNRGESPNVVNVGPSRKKSRAAWNETGISPKEETQITTLKDSWNEPTRAY